MSRSNWSSPRRLKSAGRVRDTHWSTRSMAAAAGMSQSAVSRIWRASGLRPHLVETWKLSADPQFIEKVRDVVGLYNDPPEKGLVLAVDENPRSRRWTGRRQSGRSCRRRPRRG